MKLWFRLTLVCCVLVGLLLSLTPALGLNHPWQVVGSGPWLDRGREPVSDAPTVSVVTSMEFDSARAGPRQPLDLDGTLTADRLAPPGPETHGPPKTYGALASYRSSWQLKGRHRATFSTTLLAFKRRIGESGFRNSL